MKKVILIILVFIGCGIIHAESWKIRTIYEAKDVVPQNCKALDKYGKPITSYGNSLETIDKLLVPFNLQDGKFQVLIVEISSGFYQIKDTNLYIEMEGDNLFKPTSMFNQTAKVILIKELYTLKIEYKGLY